MCLGNTSNRMICANCIYWKPINKSDLGFCDLEKKRHYGYSACKRFSKLIEITDKDVKISFFKDFFLIRVMDNSLYLNYTKLDTTYQPYGYDKKYMKDTKYMPKGVIKKLFHQGYVFEVTVGSDGRLFFKLYKKVNYNQLRGKYDAIYSYWDDKKNGQIKFYVNNLYLPQKIWLYNFKKKEKPNNLMRY